MNAAKRSPASAISTLSPKRARLSSHGASSSFVQDGAGARSSSPISIGSRVIIALDLDAFYVSACRKRDPSLIGIPIGIQQKALVATISYEARGAGVNKLDSIKDALKKCPDMVLVNGEDLTYFRQVSSQVWRLVRKIIWHKRVEKLGMDELFCDVTEMVDHHLETVTSGIHDPSTRTWFELTPPHEDKEAFRGGFHYPSWPELPPGHVHPDAAQQHLDSNRPDRYQQRMLVAAHIAYFLRQRISDEIGLTCSAGIAHAKTLAKLVGALNKPNQQTVFAPPISAASAAAFDANDGLRALGNREEVTLVNAVNAFLDPLELRKLNGFGRVVVDKICDHLEPGSGRRSNADPTNAALGRVDQIGNDMRLKLTVGVARKAMSLDAMQSLFGDMIGPKLWSLLCGRDMEPVIPAPDFPLQLSIEDTYPYPSLRGQAIQEQIEVLSHSLLCRLELELIKEYQQPDALDAVEHAPISLSQTLRDVDQTVTSACNAESSQVMVRDYQQIDKSCTATHDKSTSRGETKTWLRYPRKLRLSVRQGWNNRISKQAAMPVEVFDLTRPVRARAQIIAKACRALLRALIGGDDVVGDGMNLINIAALELSEKRPNRALDSFFIQGPTAPSPSSTVSFVERCDPTTKPDHSLAAGEGLLTDEQVDGGKDREDPPSIDRDFLMSLPADLRAEIAAEYGLDPNEVLSQKTTTATEDFREVKSKIDASGNEPSSHELLCPTCGRWMDVWLQHDHEIWPDTGLPDSGCDEDIAEPDRIGTSVPPDDVTGAVDDIETIDSDMEHCDQCETKVKRWMLFAHRRFHELENER
ncbi:DNA/RNA polymerase [Testicularia cyperi]|uniref:DNA/RNA polymerase n=1 Tax=Testicularia cyperi TaxID=1882483 RepID=A0A317XZR4_9BASI|nr:DNA/RNA polymerase [Testicularia cyperi]